jgi:hypothetical protein
MHDHHLCFINERKKPILGGCIEKHWIGRHRRAQEQVGDEAWNTWHWRTFLFFSPSNGIDGRKMAGWEDTVVRVSLHSSRRT